MSKLLFGRRAALTGYVDYVDANIVRGWAWNAATPKCRLTLDVFFRGVFLGRSRTGILRPDLRDDHGMADGCHGFLFHFPPDVKNCHLEMCHLKVTTSAPERVALMILADKERASAIYPDETDVRTFFGPLLKRIDQLSSEATNHKSDTRRPLVDRICAQALGLKASAFVEHLALKYSRPGPSVEPDKFWSWYLGHYCVERGPALAPLSAVDISLLIGPDQRHSIAARLCEPAPKRGNSGRYDWAIEGSRRLYVEDCLVDPETVTNLRNVPRWSRAQPFPLSFFLRRLLSESAMLQNFNTIGEIGRQDLYALAMVFGLRCPHYLAFLPSRWLHEMLLEGGGGSPFERALSRLFGDAYKIKSLTYRDIIRAQGFDVSSQTFIGRFYRGNRVLPRPTPRLVEVDVQVIGPFRRMLGLGESCRRLGEALRSSNWSINLVDYDVGISRATVSLADDLGALRPARINILHLNAEEIPEAIAYLPDLDAGSYLVAMPYWELNRPSAVHELGLALVDEIWVASSYLAAVFNTERVPVAKIGISYEACPILPARCTEFRARFGLARSEFVFVTTSDALSWVQRKNVLGTINAFQAAFESDEAVRLIVKTHNVTAALPAKQRALWSKISELCAEDPRLILINESFEPSDQKALLAASDCLVSLHRAEGLGLDILDALHAGMPVIATAYSGNMDYCTPETTWLVEYDMLPVETDQYAFVEAAHVWAEPRLASATLAMKDVYQAGPLGRAVKTDAARALVDAHASQNTITERVSERINAILKFIAADDGAFDS